jgi:hypothetical protein
MRRFRHGYGPVSALFYTGFREAPVSLDVGTEGDRLLVIGACASPPPDDSGTIESENDLSSAAGTRMTQLKKDLEES